MNRSIRTGLRRGVYAQFVCLTLAALGHPPAHAQVQVVPAKPECTEGGIPCAVLRAQPGRALPLGPVDVGVLDGVDVIPDHPYDARASTEVRQTLVDGTHIIHNSTAYVARDGMGRTIRTQSVQSIGFWVGSPMAAHPSTLTTVFDPVAKQHISYFSDDRIAYLTIGYAPKQTMAKSQPESIKTTSDKAHHANDIGNQTEPYLSSAEIERRSSDPGHLSSPGQLQNGEQSSRTEPLGMKTIEGIQVVGSKTTTTVPLGFFDNDKEMLLTREIWYSPELRVVLLSILNDPRFGETTYSLTNIRRGAPDPSLFRVPLDYRTKLASTPLSSY